MCVFSSHSFWTSSSFDVPAWVIQEKGHTGFLIHLLSAVRALIFLAKRIQPLLSLVDREVEFCVLTISSFSTRWAFLVLVFSFLVRKIPFARIELTSQRVRKLHGYLGATGTTAYVRIRKTTKGNTYYTVWSFPYYNRIRKTTTKMIVHASTKSCTDNHTVRLPMYSK